MTRIHINWLSNLMKLLSSDPNANIYVVCGFQIPKMDT
jgi:hypothetical protein